ncbi:ABC transporter ATP-binding protein [Marivibrio halodurans]|uniref:ABC transporter ATP-binding protein n=1 Tax=Marivibrio halodurans TaxID=2039722 RepID=A0A8J7S6M7_9PROT|nr:ABC transporter ATP-binding protein [Marivibrio halodurans]MBP5857754.1 ABC transporter ATP-binding protein [Marivibrio halodurans]
MSGVSIEVRALEKRWGETVAVDRVSFTAEAGAFTVLLGPSGCGKSTTLRLVAGLESASGGQVLIDGRDVTHRPPNGRDIAMVFQSYALFPHLNVAENILFGLKVRRVAKAERARRLDRVAEMLGLTPLLHRKPSQISGGQQQRTALARAIIAEKPICLMDEPLSNLDAKLRHEMRNELRALQRALGLTMVYVTHDQAEALSMADRIVVLNQGRVEQADAPRALYDRPTSAFVARFIGTPPMNLIEIARCEDGWRAAGVENGGTSRGGAILDRASVPVADARPVLLGVRPEDLALADAGTPGIEATVESVEYLGADNLVSCRTADQVLTARLPHRRRLQAGAPIRLTWPARAQHFFDGGSGRRLDGDGPAPIPAISKA